MSDHDIYRILENLDAAQKSVKQLPALFRPADTSPQLAGPYPGQNATRGYLVGEDQMAEGDVVSFNRGGYNVIKDKKDYLDKRDILFRMLSQSGLDPQTKAAVKERLATLDLAARNAGIIKEQQEDNPMARAVTRRIVNQHPEWIVKYGVEALMQAIDDVTEGEDFEEIGSSDVSAYVQYVKDHLDDRMGSREEMDDRRPFAEGSENMSIGQQMARDGITYSPEKERELIDLMGKYMEKAGMSPKAIRYYLSHGNDFVSDQLEHLPRKGMEEGITESATTEDVISTVKKKLGDYLSDLTKEIKKDPDLKDKLEKDIDQIGPAVKTIRTDDGHEIKIHGNEDDGFRITVKNKEMKTPFRNLDEAVMATEMYCARRRGMQSTADYVEEKTS